MSSASLPVCTTIAELLQRIAGTLDYVTMAYAILRHNGVELGKADYLVGGTAG